MMPFRRRMLGPAALALALLAADAFAAEPLEFVVLGDIPYGDDQVTSLAFIGDRIRSGGYPFVIHYGDTKSGGGSCADAVLEGRKRVIHGLLAGRVFLTPGDNDWTDCDRETAGGFDELERLAKVREIFFASGGLPADPAWRIARQTPDFPENARWRVGGVQFVTVHIVGTDNGRDRILRSDVDAALEAVGARDRANLAWLDAAFDRAIVDGAEAVVVAMQADPGELSRRDQRDRPCTMREPVVCNPYLTFLEYLTVRADTFDKPVLLVHGSTAPFCLDTGFGGWRAEKLWRLNGPGDYVTVDAAVVRFDPDARAPFQVHGLMSGDSPPRCDGL